MSPTTVVRGGHVLTMGPAGDLTGGAVAFADGQVLAVGPFAEVADRFPGAEVVGDDQGVVLPGLVNGHTHLSEALICGMGEDLTLFEWGERLVTPVGRHLTREMARVGAMLKGADLLLSGATCVNDMFCHTNVGSQASLGVVDGLEELGLRGVVAFGPEDMAEPDRHPVGDFLAEHEALAGRCAGSRLVGFRLGVGTVLGQTDELLAASARAAREHGWAVHTHLAEVREEVVMARLRWGWTSVERAADAGLLEVPVVAGHGIWVSEGEIRLLAGAGVAVVHNPVANMILGSGVCPLAALRGAGIPVGIGTDGAASNDSQNMLEAVKTAALLQKVARLDPRAVSAGDVLAMATLEGPGPSALTAWSGRWSPASGPTWSGCGATGPAWPTSTTPASRSSTAPPRPMWPTSGSTGPAGSWMVSWSATTWPPWSRPAAPWPPPWPPRPGSADAPAWPERSVAAEGAAGQGAAAGLGQEHIVGGDHHQLAAGQRAGDLAPDRPAGGVPVDRPELLQGRLLGGVEAVVGGWPWSGLAGRRALARPEPEGGCSAQPPDDIPEEPRGAAGICHWGPPDSVLAGSGPDFEVPDRLGYDPQCQVQMQLPRPSAGGQRPQTDSTEELAMMPEVQDPASFNGMPAGDLAGARWRKSGRSSAQGNCVELAGLTGGGVAVRNSRDPEGPALVFTGAELDAFLGGVRDGDFDDLLR